MDRNAAQPGPVFPFFCLSFSLDDESGVTSVQVCLGTAAGAADIYGCTPVAALASPGTKSFGDANLLAAEIKGLALRAGNEYYLTVVVVNGAGLKRTLSVEGPLLVKAADGDLGTIGADMTGDVAEFDVGQSQSIGITSVDDGFAISWRDAEASVSRVEWSVGTQSGLSDILAPVPVGVLPDADPRQGWARLVGEELQAGANPDDRTSVAFLGTLDTIRQQAAGRMDRTGVRSGSSSSDMLGPSSADALRRLHLEHGSCLHHQLTFWDNDFSGTGRTTVVCVLSEEHGDKVAVGYDRAATLDLGDSRTGRRRAAAPLVSVEVPPALGLSASEAAAAGVIAGLLTPSELADTYSGLTDTFSPYLSNPAVTLSSSLSRPLAARAPKWLGLAFFLGTISAPATGPINLQVSLQGYTVPQGRVPALLFFDRISKDWRLLRDSCHSADKGTDGVGQRGDVEINGTVCLTHGAPDVLFGRSDSATGTLTSTTLFILAAIAPDFVNTAPRALEPLSYSVVQGQPTVVRVRIQDGEGDVWDSDVLQGPRHGNLTALGGGYFLYVSTCSGCDAYEDQFVIQPKEMMGQHEGPALAGLASTVTLKVVPPGRQPGILLFDEATSAIHGTSHIDVLGYSNTAGRRLPLLVTIALGGVSATPRVLEEAGAKFTLQKVAEDYWPPALRPQLAITGASVRLQQAAGTSGNFSMLAVGVWEIKMAPVGPAPVSVAVKVQAAGVGSQGNSDVVVVQIALDAYCFNGGVALGPTAADGCGCAAGYEGATCLLRTNAAGTGSPGSSLAPVIGGVIGIMLLLALILLVLRRRRAKERNRIVSKATEELEMSSSHYGIVRNPLAGEHFGFGDEENEAYLDVGVDAEAGGAWAEGAYLDVSASKSRLPMLHPALAREETEDLLERLYSTRLDLPMFLVRCSSEAHVYKLSRFIPYIGIRHDLLVFTGYAVYVNTSKVAVPQAKFTQVNLLQAFKREKGTQAERDQALEVRFGVDVRAGEVR